MATPQELQNALMLKKTQGLTTEQAVNQSRVPVTATSQINQDRLAQNQASRQGTPTPVAPVTATSQINQDRLKNNQSRVQADIALGERPAVGTSVTPQGGQMQAPTPVTATAPTTTPNGATLDANGTVTAPTTQQDINSQLGGVIQPNGINSVQPINAVSEMPATPKVDATPGITQDAFQQAKLESEKIKAQNDAVLSQNQQKSDLAKQEQERIATEANNQLANNEGAILNTLKTGGMIPEVVKSSPFYKSAQQTYNKLQQYSTYSTNELVTAMNQGSIVPGTNVYNEMMKDPAMKQKLTDAQVYRAGNPVNSTQIYENASSEIMSNNPTTANYLADGVITKDEYNQATNNTEVVAKAKEVEEKANKYNTLKAEYDSIEDEVNKQFPGSPFADSIIADRQKSKYKNLVLAKGEWETSTGTLTELKSQASTLFETNLKLSESRRVEENKIKAEERSVQRSKDALQYEADFNKKQQEAALQDPATAIKSVMDEYKKLGIPFTSTVQSRLSEFQKSGKPLEQFLTDMGQNIQQSPAYQKYQALQQGQMSDAQKLGASQAFDLKKMGLEQDFQMAIAKAKETTDNEWKKLDDGLYTNKNGDIITGDELKTAKLMGNSNITKPVGAEGGDCGLYASRGTGMTATPGGNSKEARTQAFSDKTPEVGGMAFFGGAGYDPTYGHISIVTGVDQANGTITIKESNYNNDKKVTERTVPASSVTGYYNNTPLAKGVSGGTETKPTSSEANSWVNAWNNGTMDIETILTKIGNTKEALPLKNEVIKAIDAQGGVAWRKESDPMVTKVQSLIDTLDTSSKSSYLNTVAGTVQTSLSNFLTGGKSDLLADLKTVIEGGTLQSLIDAKAQGATFGALSNEELKMLQATSSAIAANAIRDPDTKEIIGFKMSETKLKSELEKMKNLFIEKKARMTGAGLKQETPKQSNTAPAYTAPTSNDPFGIR